MKSDSKTIQAIHDAVITHNRRVSISGDLSTTFNLLIAQVEEKDRGEYMCQINTDPMTYQAGHVPFAVHLCKCNECGCTFIIDSNHTSRPEGRGSLKSRSKLCPFRQTAYLDVMVPPDITQSTTDLELQQGETANLECRADGYPSPAISWRREGDLPIRAKDQKTGSVKKCEPTQSSTKMQRESERSKRTFQIGGILSPS